jgi:PAS domain S-box-containing protein
LEVSVSASRAQIPLRVEQAVGEVGTGFRDFLDGLFSYFGLYSTDGRILDFNQAALDLAGLGREQVVGRRLTELPFWAGMPEEGERLMGALERAAGGEAVRVETRVGRPGGGIVYVDAAFVPLRDAAGKVTQVITTGVDITTRKTIEMQLAHSERRFAEAQRVAHVGSWEWEVGGDRVAWSDELYEIYGLAKHEFDGTYAGFLSRVHPDDANYTIEIVGNALKAVTPFVYDHRVVRPDGEVRMLHTRGEVIADPRGKPMRMTGCCWDVTDKWQAMRDLEREEERLRASQGQLRALAARLDAIREEERRAIAREVHDQIGQALTVLKLDLASLRARLPPAAGDEARLQAAAMDHLIDDTLGIVRRITAELRPALLDDLGLVAAIQWQARDFGSRTGVACRVEISPDPGVPVAAGEALVLFRILQEALTNVARHARARNVVVRLDLAATEVTLTIADDGRGIDPAQLLHATSLGLVGMQERALVLGGSVTFTSAPGSGTTVMAKLPRTDPR